MSATIVHLADEGAAAAYAAQHICDPDIARHVRMRALAAPAVEVCGAIVQDHRTDRAFAVMMANVHPRPACGFRFDPGEFAALDERFPSILAIYHSHPTGPLEPSLADIHMSEKLGLPYLIYSLPDDRFCWYHPRDQHIPLVGRPFVHGVLDCYALVRDWYARECQFVLPDFERQDDWWKRGENLYEENFAACGFSEIRAKDLRYGDAILCALDSRVANHAAIYQGDGQILHHPPGRLSGPDPWLVGRGYYASRFVKALRHSSRFSVEGRVA